MSRRKNNGKYKVKASSLEQVIREVAPDYTTAPKIRSYMDLIVWQKANALFVDLISDIESFPRTKAAQVIIDQLVRAVGSISANIAEGFGRKTTGDFAYHLGIARGEANKSHNWYHKCEQIKYLVANIVSKRKNILEEIQAMLSSLISKVSQRSKKSKS